MNRTGDGSDRLFGNRGDQASRDSMTIFMNRFLWAPTILLFSLVLWWGTPHDQVAGQSSGGATGGAKRALLIGINKYQAVPKLQGSLNDVGTMKQVLMTRWGFQESNIRLLTDEQATREGILAALNQFVKDTGPRDTVYIHYSGHGSQVQDLNGDEPDDKLDETLVPQDGRTGSVPDITDDELDAIFGRLPTTNAFIVLDSCHSGTATRSLDIRTRSVPQDTRVELYRQAATEGVRTRGTIQMLSSHYVLMTGAASHQEALDGPVGGRYHGFFSYALSKSLSGSSASATPREIFRGIESELKRIQNHFGRASMPEPQLEAPVEFLDRPLLGAFGSASGPTSPGNGSRLAWLEVRTAEPGTATLVNGLLLGAGPGSIWAIYPPGDTTFTPGRALAIATVTQLTGQDATVKFQPAGRRLADRSRAVALLPASSGETIPIRILEMPSAKRKHVEDVLAQYVPNLQLVGPDQSARYMISQQGSEIQLLAADGLQVVGSFGSDSDNWGTGLAIVVSRSVTASELLTLDNPSSQLKIDARVANAPATGKPKVGTRGIAVVAADTQPARYRIRKPGKPRTAENTLQLELKVSADSYLTIVDVDSEGGVNLMFPNDYAKPGFYPDGFIRGGERVLIPDSLNSVNKAGFYWDYSPPKGTDTIRLFSSTDRETAQMIRQKIKNLQSTTAKGSVKVRTRAVTADIGGLRDDLAHRTLRGILPVSDPTPPIPGQIVSAPAAQTEMPLQQASPPAAPQQDIPAALPPDMPSAAASPASANPSAVAAAAPAADWAATSITIVVSE